MKTIIDGVEVRMPDRAVTRATTRIGTAIAVTLIAAAPILTGTPGAHGDSFMLEDGSGYLLLESGDRLLLE